MKIDAPVASFTTALLPLEHSDAKCIVIPVNCEGVVNTDLMRKMFDAYPNLLAPYVQSCQIGLLCPSRLAAFDLSGKKFILLPNRNGASDMINNDLIEMSLKALVNTIALENIKDIAIPPLAELDGTMSARAYNRQRLVAYLSTFPALNVLLHGM